MRQAGPSGEVSFPAGVHFNSQQFGQHLGIGQLLAGCGVQGVVQDLDGLLEAQGLQVLAGLFQGDHCTPPTAASSYTSRERRSTSPTGACTAIADRLRERCVKLALGRALYDPGDPMGKLFFNILATFAEFEADLIRMRTREGMAIARAKGKLCGKQPKLSDRQQRELCRMHATGEYSISDLAELFSVSRPTVYRTLNRNHPP